MPDLTPPTTAVEAAAAYGAAPRRAVDTASNSAPCWIAFEWPDSALVVYDDEQDAIVATDNHPGRFAAIAS